MPLALVPGETAISKRSFTLQDVQSYARISGRSDPLNLNASYAEATRLGKPVVPDLLAATMFSGIMGTEPNLRRAAVVGHLLKFLRPIYVGETVTAQVEVVEVLDGDGLVRLSTKAVTAKGLCIDGEAVVRTRGTTRPSG